MTVIEMVELFRLPGVDLLSSVSIAGQAAVVAGRCNKHGTSPAICQRVWLQSIGQLAHGLVIPMDVSEYKGDRKQIERERETRTRNARVLFPCVRALFPEIPVFFISF